MKIILKFFLFIFVGRMYCSDKIFVHLIPHSHMDAGWLQTENEYFWGGNKCVKCIFDNVLSCLKNNFKRKFTVSDIFFFNKWYNTKNESDKADVKNLVRSGQLNFVNGGWVMHDEATTIYNHQIDQMRIGLEFLYREFGVTVDIGWQLDPFGHSSANVIF